MSDFARCPVKDDDIQTLLQYPAAAQIVTLQLYSMPIPVTHTGLSNIAKMTALTELSIICDEQIDDEHFRNSSDYENACVN